nr:ubiquitin-related modifier 1 isoform X9 [Manis javanica]
MAAPLSVEVEFGGGAELLFDGVKKHQVTLPGQEEPWDIRNLLVWIKKNLLKERPELFIQGDSVNRWGSHFVQETAPAVPSTSQAKRDPKMFCPDQVPASGGKATEVQELRAGHLGICTAPPSNCVLLGKMCLISQLAVPM